MTAVQYTSILCSLLSTGIQEIPL